MSLSHPTERPRSIPEPPDPHPGELPAGRGGTTASACLSSGWRPSTLAFACDAGLFWEHLRSFACGPPGPGEAFKMWNPGVCRQFLVSWCWVVRGLADVVLAIWAPLLPELISGPVCLRELVL